MTKNENKDILEITSEMHPQKDEILRRADRALSVINNINREGGIVTQLQMAAACIELQSFELYLLNTYNDNVIDRNDFPDLPTLEKYIRLFKNAESDLWDDIVEHDYPEQREKQEGEDQEVIFSLKDLIVNTERLRKYEDCDDYLDSWKKIQTDIDMILNILYVVLRDIILDWESIFQIIRKSTNGTKV